MVIRKRRWLDRVIGLTLSRLGTHFWLLGPGSNDPGATIVLVLTLLIPGLMMMLWWSVHVLNREARTVTSGWGILFPFHWKVRPLSSFQEVGVIHVDTRDSDGDETREVVVRLSGDAGDFDLHVEDVPRTGEMHYSWRLRRAQERAARLASEVSAYVGLPLSEDSPAATSLAGRHLR
jgi:hypothetical protein